MGLDGADALGGARPPRRGRDEPAAGCAGRAGDAARRAAPRPTRRSPPRRCSGWSSRTAPASAATWRRIYWSAKDRKLSALNAAGWAPRAWTPEYFTRQGPGRGPDLRRRQRERARCGRRVVALPEAVRATSRSPRRCSRRSRSRSRASASRSGSAATGTATTSSTSTCSGRTRSPRRCSCATARSRRSTAPSATRISRARTSCSPKDGPDAFYRGPIGRAIVDRIQAGGGAMRMSDLSSFRSEWVKPISTNYKGYDVYETPPQTQGFATLEMLNIIEQCGPRLGYDLRALGRQVARVLAHPHRGQEARLRGPAALQRRPALRRRPARPAALQALRGVPLRPDRPRPRGGAGEHRRAEPHGQGEGRHRVPGRRGPVGEHGLLHLLDLRLLRLVRVGPGLRLPAQRPRVVLLARPVLAGRRRSASSGRS